MILSAMTYVLFITVISCKREDSSVNKYDNESRAWGLSGLLLHESIRIGYSKFCINLIKEFELSNYDVPSIYHFIKRRHKTKDCDSTPCNILYDYILIDDIDVQKYYDRF